MARWVNRPKQLTDAMHAAWVRFAKVGDPGWSRYDLASPGHHAFDLQSHVVDDPYARERALSEVR